MRACVLILLLASCQPDAELDRLRVEVAELRAMQQSDEQFHRVLLQTELEEVAALHETARQHDSARKLDEIIDLALSGRQFSPPELIAMQAAVYKHTSCQDSSKRGQLDRRISALARLRAAIDPQSNNDDLEVLKRSIPTDNPADVDGRTERARRRMDVKTRRSRKWIEEFLQELK